MSAEVRRNPTPVPGDWRYGRKGRSADRHRAREGRQVRTVELPPATGDLSAAWRTLAVAMTTPKGKR